MEDWPQVGFIATREHGQRLAQGRRHGCCPKYHRAECPAGAGTVCAFWRFRR